MPINFNVLRNPPWTLRQDLFRSACFYLSKTSFSLLRLHREKCMSPVPKIISTITLRHHHHRHAHTSVCFLRDPCKCCALHAASRDANMGKTPLKIRISVPLRNMISTTPIIGTFLLITRFDFKRGFELSMTKNLRDFCSHKQPTPSMNHNFFLFSSSLSVRIPGRDQIVHFPSTILTYYLAPYVMLYDHARWAFYDLNVPTCIRHIRHLMTIIFRLFYWRAHDGH